LKFLSRYAKFFHSFSSSSLKVLSIHYYLLKSTKSFFFVFRLFCSPYNVTLLRNVKWLYQ
jgi:hypothetical protein